MTINWKARARKWEQEALTANENLVKVAFCLEKEKALRRRADEQITGLEEKLYRAITALDSAVEIFTTPERLATARTFHMIADDLRPRDTCAMGIVPKDEQH